MKRSNTPVNSAKCTKCQGVPSQHNIREAEIYVPATGKTHTQHNFAFAGNNK